MHPEIVRDQPGNCPICGMALEPRNVAVDAANPELANMTRRFWVAVGLTLPLLAVMVSDMLPGHPLQHLLPGRWLGWVEFAFATPVVLWAGWPFFERGWASVVHRSPNMFTLISIGAGAAYLYSLAAVVAPGIFPATFRDMSGNLALYFEAAAVITALGAVGAGIGVESPGPDEQRDQGAPRACPKDGTPDIPGRKRSRCRFERDSGWGPPACSPRGKGPHGWICDRRAQFCG